MTIEAGPNLWKVDDEAFLWENAYTRPSIGYKLWYFYLRFSDYYYTAHKIALGEELSARERLLCSSRRFAEVTRTYADFGNVWDGLFETWWEFKGEFLFGAPGIKPQVTQVDHIANGAVTDIPRLNSKLCSLLSETRTSQNNPESLLLHIPLTGTKSEIRKSIDLILQGFDTKTIKQARYQINNKSLRDGDLTKNLDIMWCFCNPDHDKYWKIGHRNNLGDSYFDPLSESAVTMNKKRKLGKFTYEKIQSIRRIIESSAHGAFPTPISDVEHIGMRESEELDSDARTYKSNLFSRLIAAKFKEQDDAEKRNLDLSQFEVMDEALRFT